MKLVCLFMCVTLGYSSTLLVPSEYTTIGAAIEASTSGDTVLVSSGLYQENINYSGKSIALISESGPDATEIRRDSTTLDTVVSIVSGEGEGTILQGLP